MDSRIVASPNEVTSPGTEAETTAHAPSAGDLVRIDLTPILRRRRWRQAAQLGIFFFGNFGLAWIIFAVVTVHRGGLPLVWGIVDAVVVVIGLLTVGVSVALIVGTNRHRAFAVSLERTLTVVLALLFLASGGLTLAFGKMLGIVSLLYGIFFAAVALPGTISTARSLRRIAAGGRDGLLATLALGQASVRELLGKRPELSRVPPWHLYVAIALTFALPLTLELIIGIPHGVLPIVAVNLGGIVLWVAVSLAIRRYISRRMLDLSGALDADPRPPVLYLRSFSSDRRRIWMFPRLYPDFAGQAYRMSKPFDEFVGDALSQGGPVVAIGEPGRDTKTLGVATEQLDDSVWQAKALELMGAAGMIVILAGRTGGVRWEIEQLAAARQLDKTLFLLPKNASDESSAEWHSLCDILAEHGVVGLRERVDVRAAVAVLPSYGREATVISVKRKSASAYALGVRAALLLRANPEGALARIAPSPSRWLRVPALAGAVVFALLSVIGAPLGAAEAWNHSTVVAPDQNLVPPDSSSTPADPNAAPTDPNATPGYAPDPNAAPTDPNATPGAGTGQ